MNFKNLISIVFVLFFLIFYQTQSRAQAYNFQDLSIQQGLPQSQAYTILFDSTQHAWIGTQGGGLCRYDGFEFNYITKKDSLISNRIYSLEQIGKNIWVGQKGGVSIFDNKGLFIRNYRFSSPSIVVNDIAVYQNQTYFATDSGPMYLDEDLIRPYESNVTILGKRVFSFFLNLMFNCF